MTSVTSRDVREKYEIERSQLGHGHYGVVRRCWDKATREVCWRCVAFCVAFVCLMCFVCFVCLPIGVLALRHVVFVWVAWRGVFLCFNFLLRAFTYVCRCMCTRYILLVRRRGCNQYLNCHVCDRTSLIFCFRGEAFCLI